MDFSFFTRPALKKIIAATDAESGVQARRVLEGIVRELPDVLLTYVAEIASGSVLASYTTDRNYNPNKVSLRNARMFSALAEALAANPWLGGPAQDLTVILEDQFHYLHRCNHGQWYCFVAVLTADANLGIVKEVTRRYAA